MKAFLIILTIICASCQTKPTRKVDLESQRELSTELDSKLTISCSFDNYFDVEKLKFDSLNRYGGGDCWGTVRQYSKVGILVGIDSMICSEYRFVLKKVLFRNGQLEKAYIKESSTLFEFNGEVTKYELTETLIDLASATSNYLTRKDTVLEPKFELINKGFRTEIEENYKQQIERLLTDYKRVWEMTEDF